MKDQINVSKGISILKQNCQQNRTVLLIEKVSYISTQTLKSINTSMIILIVDQLNYTSFHYPHPPTK